MTGGITDSRRHLIDHIVPVILDHLHSTGIDLHELAADPATVVAAVEGLAFDWVSTDTIGGTCSVAALYSATENPPRISVALDASPGRRAFSVLHEFGHHLCRTADEVSDILFELPDAGAGIEEDLVDAFAAAVLLPHDKVRDVLNHGVDAASVLRLWRATSASREACCVAAAALLPAPGYVMLLRRDGRCQFAARHGDVYPVARNSRQNAIKLRPALRGGTARGVDRPEVGSGVATAQMHLDACADGEYIIVVWVTDSPAWDALPISLDSAPVGHEGYCESCAKEFTAWRARCQKCTDPFCPTCGTCQCDPVEASRLAQRKCERCYLLLPASAFVDDATVCNEH
ncbi:ImmA/IrrE family metallo-endopeptidase [Micromonospora matsumotoense]|uniref:ImmA/IrrE family metallo-endopeptidase n=1 Tax=Micromonospora matsumotoense TaxID=121616 RepID=UPI003449A67C